MWAAAMRTYTLELAAEGPTHVLGIDAAAVAVDGARARATERGLTNVEFAVGDAYELEKLGRRFDVAVIRGVLHHLYQAERAVQSVLKVASEIVIVEPNGYNPILKLIEKNFPVSSGARGEILSAVSTRSVVRGARADG